MRAILVSLLVLAGCVRAVTPDGRDWSCVKHTAPVREHGGIWSTHFDSGGSEYSCIGHNGEMPLVRGQTAMVGLK